MTTNFALSLSYQGIRLLHRVADGWHLVSETELDVPDLAAALSQMRDDALALDPSGIRTKILIPNEQIKYVTLETAQTNLDDVMGALEGATPYPTSDLVVDFDRNGGRTFIAAVARETLSEAEGFAVEHNFNPVSFAAIPEAMTFGGEVFFGPSSVTKDAVVRDDAAVVVTGTATLPAAALAADDVPLFTPRARMATPESVAPPAPQTVVAPDATEVMFTPREAPAVDVPDAPKPAPPVTPDAGEMADKGGFSSSRAPLAAPSKTPDAPDVPAKPAKQSRKEKKAAAFATKQAAPVRKKPRFLGLILTAILLVFMALVAMWASTLSEEDVAGWFGYGTGGILETAEIPPPEIVTDTAVIQDLAVAPQADAPDATAPVVLPVVRDTALGRVLSPAEADRIYAATGVWQRAPRLPLEPREETFAANIPALAATNVALPRPALPNTASQLPDLALLAPQNPPAFGTDFDRDANGFILATPDGVMTPQGAFVIAGAPPKKPPQRVVPVVAELPSLPDAPDGVVVIAGSPPLSPPARPQDAALPDPQPEDVTSVTPGGVALASLRPSQRPQNLAPEAPELPEFTSKRPRTRPSNLVAQAPDPEPAAPAVPDITDVVAAIADAAPPSPFVAATSRAVGVSSRPDTRPRNFARLVARARDLEAQQAARAAAAAARPAAAVTNQTVRPSGNTTGSVAQAATLDNAIRLRDVNLIGVYGRPNDRRALVRLGNGRYVKVEVGSRLDGGRVSAIGDSALNYVKRGKTIALQLPSG